MALNFEIMSEIIAVCVPVSNHFFHVSENVLKKKSNWDDLDLLVTFKSNLSLQNV